MNPNTSSSTVPVASKREPPFFSIVIPAYNIETFLPDMLSSILGQTYRNLEVIVVDDASSDRTREVTSQYAASDSRVRILSHASNKGQLTARLTGAHHASGEYLWLVDGDDLVNIHACEVLFAALDSTTSVPDLVSFSYCLAHSRNHTVADVRHQWAAPGFYEGKQAIARFIACNSTNPIWSKLVRKEFFLRNHPILDGIGLWGAEDIAYHYFYAQAKSILVLDNVLYYYRSPRPGSDSSGVSRRQLTGVLDVTLYAMNLFRKSDFPSKEKSLVIRRYARNVLSLHDYLWLNLSVSDRKEYAPKFAVIFRELTRQDQSDYARWYDNFLKEILVYSLKHLPHYSYFLLKIYFCIYFIFHMKTYLIRGNFKSI